MEKEEKYLEKKQSPADYLKEKYSEKKQTTADHPEEYLEKKQSTADYLKEKYLEKKQSTEVKLKKNYSEIKQSTSRDIKEKCLEKKQSTADKLKNSYINGKQLIADHSNKKNRTTPLNEKNRKDRNKLAKEVFFEDNENCEGPFYHIMMNIEDPALIEIDNFFAVADNLSIKNAQRHQNTLLALSILGPLISIVFFLYFEGEQHGMIILCTILLLILYMIHRQSIKLDCHRKYLEYRVFAETLRVQFFLSMAKTGLEATEISPWFIKKGIPWIEEIMKNLPVNEVKEKHDIMYFWVFDQKSYHEGALTKAENEKKRQKKIEKIAITLTILAYLLGLAFEGYMYFCSPNIDAHLIRLGLKIIIGSMSVGTIFLENYYGKMSLSEKINNHKRMIKLYEKIRKEILKKGETPEIIEYLAREFLIENTTWYAYQNKNKAELVF